MLQNGNVGIGTTSPITLLSNTATALADLDGTGVLAGGLTWSGLGGGYVAGIVQTGSSPGAIEMDYSSGWDLPTVQRMLFELIQAHRVRTFFQ